jgi:hypothetical protein
MFFMDYKCVCMYLREATYLRLWRDPLTSWIHLGCLRYVFNHGNADLTVATSHGSLLGARIMQGFGTGPFEMLVPSSIGDMYSSRW